MFTPHIHAHFAPSFFFCLCRQYMWNEGDGALRCMRHSLCLKRQGSVATGMHPWHAHPLAASTKATGWVCDGKHAAGAGAAAAGAAKRGTGAKAAATTTCAKPAGKPPRPRRERRGRAPHGRFGLGSACACGACPWRRRGGWPRATGADSMQNLMGKTSTVERVDSDGDMRVLGKCWNPAMVERA